MFLQLPRGTRFIHPSLRFGLRHLRAVALRLPFGTIFKISPSIRRRAFFVCIFLGAYLNCRGSHKCSFSCLGAPALFTHDFARSNCQK